MCSPVWMDLPRHVLAWAGSGILCSLQHFLARGQCLSPLVQVSCLLVFEMLPNLTSSRIKPSWIKNLHDWIWNGADNWALLHNALQQKLAWLLPPLFSIHILAQGVHRSTSHSLSLECRQWVCIGSTSQMFCPSHLTGRLTHRWRVGIGDQKEEEGQWTVQSALKTTWEAAAAWSGAELGVPSCRPLQVATTLRSDARS